MFNYNFKTLEDKYSRMLNEIENFLYSAPRGYLKTRTRGNCNYYYYCDDEENKMYIQKDTLDGKNLIRELAQKRYCKLLLPVVKQDLDAVRIFKRRSSKNSIAEVYDSLPDAIKEYVDPFEISNEEHARRWSLLQYKKKNPPTDGSVYKTKKGEVVRSKTELIIADKLYDLEIPYKYEKIYTIPGYGKFAPDFTILNKQTRQVYIWEHFGLMGYSDYRAKAFEKIEMYTEFGVQAGLKFIFTFEDGDTSISTNHIDNIISSNFLL